ncbi:DUF4190 domain-containing protein [Subtercola endophyticus]|uniref:DUF4190 domain-containing protein n=1 Tax=Subtercola endophyticus TaxID=2895559 RepID=UPI001E4741E0|nr:DUF4190 domain-containing protein [Subtercola endophyticus]UFS59974.1 hypothetical protein LQ955_04100 [Subtercola endophyticus]
MTDTTPTPPEGDVPNTPPAPPADAPSYQAPIAEPPAVAPVYQAPPAPPSYQAPGVPPSYQAPGVPPAYQPGAYPPAPGMPPGYGQQTQRPPFSRLVIAGFVLSCVSIFVFGFLGVLGVVLASQGLRAVRRGLARGRGLAIAAMVIGVVGFVFYAVGLILNATR